MEISAHIICIGNEILLGHINNTNAQYISKGLSSIGIDTRKHLSVQDRYDAIISSIKGSLLEANILVLSGGLGPTVDDITLECISKALNKKLAFNNTAADHIRGHFKKRRLKMPENNLRQALVPEGAKAILNDIGTAPGLIIPVPWASPSPGPRALIALPGVPFELYPMFEKTVLPYLRKAFRPDRIIKSRIIRITGLPESEVNEKIEDILRLGGDVRMGIYPHPEEISVKITVTGRNKNKVDSTIRGIEKRIRARLRDYIFGYDDDTLESAAGKALSKNKKTLAVAESCTGGLLADRITDIPGSSDYFRMGVVAYSNEAKSDILRIPLQKIKQYGAVSRQVASLMAKNVRRLAGAGIGIGISGIAGPGGASKKKPVGLVYIAVSTQAKTVCRECRFLGQRDIIKYKASQTALDMLRKI